MDESVCILLAVKTSSQPVHDSSHLWGSRMKNRLVTLLGALALSLVGMPGTSSAMPLATMPTTMYVLGDSLSDVGNLFIATSPLPGGPLPQDPPYFQGRFSNGQIYAEYLWQNLGFPGDLSPSLAGGTNYAVGGARSRYHRFDLDGTFDPLADTSGFAPFTLLGQRDALLDPSTGPGGGSLDASALYTVWNGSNDVADAFAIYAGGDPTTALALLAQSASDLVGVIGSLATAGARDFLIPTVPNLGLVPEVQALLPIFPGAQSLAETLSQTFNGFVDAGLAGIGANIIRLDTFELLTALANDPTAFDLPADLNTKDACFSGFVGVGGTVCDNPENYLFWDMIHPSALTHRVLGNAARAAVVPEPGLIVLMGIGLVALVLQRRHKPAQAPVSYRPSIR